MQSWTKRDFFTYLVLFVLLFVRFPIADFLAFIGCFFDQPVFSFDLESLRSLQDHFIRFFYGYSFILVAIVIGVNWRDLERLNINKGFVLIFLCGGLAYGWEPNNWQLGIVSNWQLRLVTVLVSLFVFVLYAMGWLKFGDVDPSLGRIVIIILIGFLLATLSISNSINFTKIRWIIQWFLIFLPLVIVEEVVYRGILWMFLKGLNFSDFKVVILQAILFWFSHVDSYSDAVFFFIIIPIISVLLGVIVWRSKSIAPSVIAHVLFNVLLGLIQTKDL